MSVNLSVKIVIGGYEDAREREVVLAVTNVLVEEDVRDEFRAVRARKARNGPRQVTTATRSSIIVNRSLEWEADFRGKLEAQVKAANGAACTVHLEVEDVDYAAALKRERAARKRRAKPTEKMVIFCVKGELRFANEEALEASRAGLERVAGVPVNADSGELVLRGEWRFEGTKPRRDAPLLGTLLQLAEVVREAMAGQLFVSLPGLNLSVHRGGFVSIVHTSKQAASHYDPQNYPAIDGVAHSNCTAFALSPDGSKCAMGVLTIPDSGPSRASVVLADAATGSQLDRLVDLAGEVQRFAFSSCGQRLLAVSQGLNLALWEVRGELLAGASAHIHATAGAVKWVLQRRILGSYDKRDRTWMGGLQPLSENRWVTSGGHCLGIWSPRLELLDSTTEADVFFGPIISLPDGSGFWSLNLDRTLRLWRIDPLECVYRHAIEVTAMALSNSTLFVVEAIPGQEPVRERTFNYVLPSPHEVYKKQLRAIDPSSGETRWVTPLEWNPWGLVCSPDGSEILGLCEKRVRPGQIQQAIARRWSSQDGHGLEGLWPASIPYGGYEGIRFVGDRAVSRKGATVFRLA